MYVTRFAANADEISLICQRVHIYIKPSLEGLGRGGEGGWEYMGTQCKLIQYRDMHAKSVNAFAQTHTHTIKCSPAYAWGDGGTFAAKYAKYAHTHLLMCILQRMHMHIFVCVCARNKKPFNMHYTRTEHWDIHIYSLMLNTAQTHNVMPCAIAVSGK